MNHLDPGHPRTGSARIFAVLLVLAWTGFAPVEAAEIECTILYETPDGLFVDAGSDRGVEVGSTGAIIRDGDQIARVSVVRVTKSTALITLVTPPRQDRPVPGDRVYLMVSDAAPAQKEETRGERSPTLKESRDDEEFVPLLALPERSVGLTTPSNLFHGTLSLRQLLQVDSEELRDYSVTRVGSHGSLERIEGSPWNLEWSGDVEYRDGHALEDAQDYQEPQLYLYRLAFFRKFDDSSMVRVGRFLPRELPSVGYLDGAQGEKALGEHFRVGAMAGLKPTLSRLDFSVKEPTVVPYLTVSAGERSGFYYSGTAGVLGSLYEGKENRLALLLDQAASFGSRFSLFATGEVDFDIGNMETRSGTRLTRLDVFASYAIAPFLGVRIGVDHYERPDTPAERDQLEFQDDDFFDRGYWRYWAGSTQSLPWDLQLSEEISFTDSEEEDYELRWLVSLTRIGLPWLPAASVTASAYNLEGAGVDGYGGRLSANLPLMNHSLSIMPSVAMRLIEDDAGDEDFDFTDVALQLNWMITPAWTLYSSVSHAFGDETNRYFVELGVSFRW